jgi:hypothetical protein
MAKKATEAQPQQLNLTVSYGDVSIGDKTARISVKVDRDSLNIKQADSNLCDKRIHGTIVRRPKGEAADQGRLDGMADIGVHRMPATFDVKGFHVTAKHIGFGLTFAIASIDIGQLVTFAKRSGTLVIDRSEAIPDEEEDDAEGIEVEE